MVAVDPRGRGRGRGRSSRSGSRSRFEVGVVVDVPPLVERRVVLQAPLRERPPSRLNEEAASNEEPVYELVQPTLVLIYSYNRLPTQRVVLLVQPGRTFPPPPRSLAS